MDEVSTTPILDRIGTPADLRSLSDAELRALAEEIRQFLVTTVSKTGGHLGPNLGVVELTLALHRVFDTPEDKLLFDVSHQGYVHNFLTGRLGGLGMAVARDRRGSKENVVVVAGDAAFTCGISYEALNNVSHNTKRFIVVLNDNEWSIAKNVGAIANYLNRIVTNAPYSHLNEKAAKFVEMMGGN